VLHASVAFLISWSRQHIKNRFIKVERIIRSFLLCRITNIRLATYGLKRIHRFIIIDACWFTIRHKDVLNLLYFNQPYIVLFISEIFNNHKEQQINL